jgi:pimeloyl-ACP methyl ester carboxylesterase
MADAAAMVPSKAPDGTGFIRAGSGAPVLFIHGVGMSAAIWQPQIALMQDRFDLIAIDMLGHGVSPLPPQNAALADFADQAIRLLDHLGLDRVAVVGHSMGALVALEAANRKPERVERIACIGVAYPMKVSEAFLEAARKNEQAAFDMETIWGHAPQVPFGGNPNPGMWMYGDALARLARLAPGVLYSDLKACNDYASDFASVKCPVLFILGRRDVMTPPRAAAALTQKLPNARVEVVERSGHGLMAEAPDDTLDALVGFFSEIRTGRPGR